MSVAREEHDAWARHNLKLSFTSIDFHHHFSMHAAQMFFVGFSEITFLEEQTVVYPFEYVTVKTFHFKFKFNVKIEENHCFNQC